MSTKKKSKDDALEVLEDLAGEKLTLGSFLHAIRKGEDLTQVEFAKVLNISKQDLCDIERGRRFVSPKAAARFANILGFLQNNLSDYP